MSVKKTLDKAIRAVDAPSYKVGQKFKNKAGSVIEIRVFEDDYVAYKINGKMNSRTTTPESFERMRKFNGYEPM